MDDPASCFFFRNNDTASLASETFVAVSVNRNGTRPDGTGVNSAPSSETVPLSLLCSESSYLRG